MEQEGQERDRNRAGTGQELEHQSEANRNLLGQDGMLQGEKGLTAGEVLPLCQCKRDAPDTGRQHFTAT